MSRVSGTFITAVMTIILSACTLDAPQRADDQRTEPAISQAEVQAQPASSEADKPAKPPGADGDVISPAAGCSIVQFCDAPGTDGTRCLQQGCSFDAARTECINEGWAVCGTPKCPWALIDLNGVRHELCI